MICRSSDIFYRPENGQILPKKNVTEVASLWKLKTM